MNGGLFQRASPGDRMGINARDFNAMKDAAEANRKKRTLPFDTLSDEGYPVTRVKVQNNSGADANRFDVMGLNGPIITPTESLGEFQRGPAFVAVSPVAGTHEDMWCVLLEPIANGAIGMAAIAGTVPVQITGSAQGYAEIQNASPILQMSATGSARVLWADSGSGTRWALARLGEPAPSEAWVTVSSTTVTNGTQPGNLQTVNISGTSPAFSSGASIRVWQVNGYTLATGKYFKARLEGKDGSGNLIYSTSDQTGFSGTVTPWIGCSSGTPTTETLTYQDGILNTAA